MRDLLSFFTRIPTQGEIEKAREEMWMLPLLGLITSAIPSLILYLSLPLKGLISILLLYLIIGMIHLDGAADFFDGLMAKGNETERIRVMRSPDTGVAGVFSVLMILLIQISALDFLPPQAFWMLILAEMNSKMSMILMLRRKEFINGLGRFFMEGMNPKRLFASIMLYSTCFTLVSLFAQGLTFSYLPYLTILSLFTPICVAKISIKSFGGMNGDCIGASAELTRVASLLIGVILWAYLR